MAIRHEGIGALAAATKSPGRRKTAHDFVLETLREAILNGDLPGGTRLVQSELADMLDVSTTPVREALRDLAADGLVQLDAHRGGVVAELDNQELREIYDLRVLLEPEVIRRAWPELTDEVVDRVASLHARMSTATTASEWVAVNTEFHWTIYEQARSPRLLALLKALTDPWVMYVSAAMSRDPVNRQLASEGHDQILEALRTRDLQAAIEATLAHLSITRATLQLE